MALWGLQFVSFLAFGVFFFCFKILFIYFKERVCRVGAEEEGEGKGESIKPTPWQCGAQRGD